jgi:Tfp pilus assembly protein PilN
MIRINLLPPEITEKRKAERRWNYVVLAAVALYVLLGVFWFAIFLQVTTKAADVAGKQQEARSLQAQASGFKIFEDRQQDLQTRQSTADKALEGRIAFSRLFSELALVLPSDAWLTRAHADEKAFTVAGDAVDSQGDQSSSGFKPIAKLLVHLADVQQLENVWLSSSSKQSYLQHPVLQFEIGADVASPTVSPAPPKQ